MRHLTALNASARPTSGRTTWLTSPMRRAASSVMVPVPAASAIVAPDGALSSTVNSSAPSARSSASVVTATLRIVSPGSKRSVPSSAR